MDIALIEFVKNAFAGKVDKAGTPYYFHCETVSKYAEQFAKWAKFSKHEIDIISKAAFLHDVLEDTNYTESDLLKYVSQEVVDIVKIMTHDKSMSYNDYFLNVMGNRYASVVKLADMYHNSDITRFSPEEQKNPKNINRINKKYKPRMKFLYQNLLISKIKNISK